MIIIQWLYHLAENKHNQNEGNNKLIDTKLIGIQYLSVLFWSFIFKIW